jgi:hypothetical protein
LVGVAIKAGLEANISTIIVLGVDRSKPEQVVVLHPRDGRGIGGLPGLAHLQKRTVSTAGLIVSLRADLEGTV